MMYIVQRDGTREPFDPERLLKSLERRGLKGAPAQTAVAYVAASLRKLSTVEVAIPVLTDQIGRAIAYASGPSEAEVLKAAGSVFDLDLGYTWDELAPYVKTFRLPTIPHIATLAAPSGRYVGDHLTVTRNMAVAIWRQMQSGGELADGLEDQTRKQLQHMAYAAAVHLARAESAANDAAYWRISGLKLATREQASGFVQERLDALLDAKEQLGKGLGALAELKESANAAGGGGVLLGDGAAVPNGNPTKPGQLAEDAIDQATAILNSIEALAGKLSAKQEKDKLTELIEHLSKALLNGTKAAIISAVAALIKNLADDASPEDIDISVKDGVVTIYFRIRKGCLFVLDWAVPDEYIFIKKALKGNEFVFRSGEKAKAAEKEREESEKSGKPK